MRAVQAATSACGRRPTGCLCRAVVHCRENILEAVRRFKEVYGKQ